MSDTLSRRISSNQPGIHPRLAITVARHLRQPFRKPFADHNRRVFDKLAEAIDPKRPIVLDSFCGVGQSTAELARQHPDCQVIGIDQSAQRLAKHSHYQLDGVSNYWLVRANTDDLWRLMQAQQWRLHRHCIFYPNPWPKAQHLQRRIHGSPLFAALLALGGELELRSNWSLYTEECAVALRLAGKQPTLSTFFVPEPVTPFEAKYQQSGHTLWRCICPLN